MNDIVCAVAYLTDNGSIAISVHECEVIRTAYLSPEQALEFCSTIFNLVLDSNKVSKNDTSIPSHKTLPGS